MEIRHLKAACELSVIALERLANGDVLDPQKYARDVLMRVRKWYPAEHRVQSDLGGTSSQKESTNEKDTGEGWGPFGNRPSR